MLLWPAACNPSSPCPALSAPSSSRQAGTPNVWTSSPLPTFGAARPLLSDSRRLLGDTPKPRLHVGVPSSVVARQHARPVHAVPGRAAYTPTAAPLSPLPWMTQPREAREAAAQFPPVAATPAVVDRQRAVPLPHLGFGGSRPPLGGVQQPAQVSHLWFVCCMTPCSLTVCAAGLCAQTQQGMDAYLETYRQLRPDAAPKQGQHDQPPFASPPTAVPHGTPRPVISGLDEGAHQMQAGLRLCARSCVLTVPPPLDAGLSPSARTLALDEQRRQVGRQAVEVHAGAKSRQLDARVESALVESLSRCGRGLHQCAPLPPSSHCPPRCSSRCRLQPRNGNPGRAGADGAAEHVPAGADQAASRHRPWAAASHRSTA